MQLDTLGDKKTALFLIMSDTDATFNFLISMIYTQLFNLLCEKADDVYGGRLPVHVRCLIDAAANIGQIPNLEKLVATIRSREISAYLVLQAQSQLKAIYKDNSDTIIGNMDSRIFLGGSEPTTLKELNAMISMIENNCVERKQWITHDEMMNVTVIAESTPDPIAINCATFTGYKRAGFIGALVATLGIVVPSFVVIYLISMFLDNFLGLTIIANAFKGIKIAVGILILDVSRILDKSSYINQWTAELAKLGLFQKDLKKMYKEQIEAATIEVKRIEKGNERILNKAGCRLESELFAKQQTYDKNWSLCNTLAERNRSIKEECEGIIQEYVQLVKGAGGTVPSYEAYYVVVLLIIILYLT